MVISDIISREEVEDQFLRLKEVFDLCILIDIDSQMFINRGIIPTEHKPLSPISLLISKEELEYQFLRITELFRCHSYFYYQNIQGIQCAIVEINSQWVPSTKKKILEELDLIKTRMEIEYPIKMRMEEDLPPGWDPSNSVYIRILIEYK